MENTSLVLQNKLVAILDSIPAVYIDDNGKFKYILIKTYYKDQENSPIYFLRGTEKKANHADIFELFRNELIKSKKFTHVDNPYDQIKINIIETRINEQVIFFDCVGGGRIEHSSSKKEIFIFGYSNSFGQAQHEISQQMLQNQYNNYQKENIKWSNEGY